MGPASVQKSLSLHPRQQVEQTWRDAHFIEYYFVGLGGYCGMVEPIELSDNNFIAVRHVDGVYGNSLYVEFQHGTDGNIGFDAIEHFEYFDLDKDPHQLENIYESLNASLKQDLHEQVQSWLHCKGSSCA